MFNIKRLGGLLIAGILGGGVVLLSPGLFSESDSPNQGSSPMSQPPTSAAPTSTLASQPASSAASSSATAAKTEKSPGEQLLEVVPDGGSITYDELTKKVGPEVQQLFAWAKPKTISRNGNHFILECDPGASVAAGGITLKLAQKVEADLTVYPDGVGLTGVKGANVSWGGFNLLKVREVRIERDGNDKVKVSGKAEISRFLPYVPFSVTLSADDLK